MRECIARSNPVSEFTCRIHQNTAYMCYKSSRSGLTYENMLNAKDEYSEEEYTDSLQHINENIEEIKQHLLDDNMVVKKGTNRLTVKNYPN